MPVIDIPFGELRRLSGLDRSIEWFSDAIPMTGASFEGAEGDTMRFEFFPNRPDHYSVEGVARTLRSLYTDSPPPAYSISGIGGTLEVMESTRGVRPVIVCGIIRGIDMGAGLLQSMIDLQEKLHVTVGRRRRKVAIGLHDMEHVKFPLRYAAYGGGEYSFVPLGMSKELSLSGVMAEHEKGVEYGGILGDGPYPLITDAAGSVLSMPPVINGSMTQITEGTRDLFIDVTGTSRGACSGVLNILVAALADRGGRVEGVTLTEGGRSGVTPDLNANSFELTSSGITRLLGVQIGTADALSLLRRMGHSCEADGETIVARSPPYRMDIMHPVDLMEDAAIAYGFNRFGGTMPREQTVGSRLEMSSWSDGLAELMLGYGYTQVVTFMISGSTFEFGRMSAWKSDAVRIMNPVLEEYDMLRTSLIPGMLLLLEANKHNELPQRIFEIGDVHTPGCSRHFAALGIHPKASFAECKSLSDALGRDLRLAFEYAPSGDSRFIEGRRLAVRLAGEHVGMIGELHPDVITNFNLYNPIAAIEIDIQKALMLR